MMFERYYNDFIFCLEKMDRYQNYFNIKDTSVSAAMAPTNISKSHAELFLNYFLIIFGNDLYF